MASKFIHLLSPILLLPSILYATPETPAEVPGQETAPSTALPTDSITNVSENDSTASLEETSLDELVVTAARFNMKSTPGGFVFDPREVYSHSSDAAQVLEFVPMVEIEGESLNILAKKKGALILINGALPSYPQETVLDKLHSLRPTDIKKVEILTNPGAAYSQDEIARGVINIILEDRYRGANGGLSTNLYWSERRLSSISPRLYGFYQNHSLLLSAYGTYSNFTNAPRTTSTLQDTRVSLERTTVTDGKTHSNDMNLMLSGELRLPRSQAVTVSVGVAGRESGGRTTVTDEESRMEEGHNILTQSSSESRSDSPFSPVVTAGVRYRKDFRADGSSNLQLRVHGQFPRRMSSDDILRYTTLTSPGMDAARYSERVQSNVFRHDFKAARAQFDHTFGDGGQLTVVAFVTEAPQSREYSDPENYFRIRVDERAAHFKASYRKEWSKAFNTQIGLSQWNYRRRLSLDSETGSHLYRRSLLLPDISLGLQLGGGRHNLNLGWGMDFNVPYMDMLNPYRFWSSATEYTAGNPELGVAKSQYVSLSYSFLGNLFLSATYGTGNWINYDYRYIDAEGNTVRSYLDDTRNHVVSLSLSYTKWLFDYRWKLSGSGYASWRDCSSASPSGYFGTTGWNWSLNFNTLYRISEKNRFDWTLGYSFMPEYRNLGTRVSSTQDISTGFSKGLWKNAEVDASVSVPLTGRSTTYLMPGLRQEVRSRYNKDVTINFTFTWRFGKTTIETADFVNS